jgi:tRNA uridine 5-carbamoylmethylation protein Kti12
MKTNIHALFTKTPSKTKQLTFIFSSLFFGLMLTACTKPAENPKAVAAQYWLQLQAGNTTEAEKFATINSRDKIPEHSQRISSITNLENGETKTVVSTTITTTNPDTNYTHSQTFDTVLVLQQGQWKVDANASQIPPAPSAQKEELQKLAEELSESMQKNIESIDEAVNQGMTILNETLREGSKEMGESLLDMMKELNKSMHESIDKMKKQKQPDPTQGEGKL